MARISDPERIRALAHPTRLELLDHLSEVGEATATQCAEAVGESVASCSFHLRMLAKYGYVEPAGRRGREKPWRLVAGDRDLRPAPEVSGSLRAVTEVATLTVLRESERLQRFLAAADAEPDEWLQATTLTTAGLWLTREEMAELSERVQRLTEPYTGRSGSSRPAGSRRVRLLGAVHPDPDAGPAGDRGGDR